MSGRITFTTEPNTLGLFHIQTEHVQTFQLAFSLTPAAQLGST